jgi:hypothetical protein
MKVGRADERALTSGNAGDPVVPTSVRLLRASTTAWRTGHWRSGGRAGTWRDPAGKRAPRRAGTLTGASETLLLKRGALRVTGLDRLLTESLPDRLDYVGHLVTRGRRAVSSLGHSRRCPLSASKLGRLRGWKPAATPLTPRSAANSPDCRCLCHWPMRPSIRSRSRSAWPQ